MVLQKIRNLSHKAVGWFLWNKNKQLSDMKGIKATFCSQVFYQRTTRITTQNNMLSLQASMSDKWSMEQKFKEWDMPVHWFPAHSNISGHVCQAPAKRQ